MAEAVSADAIAVSVEGGAVAAAVHHAEATPAAAAVAVASPAAAAAVQATQPHVAAPAATAPVPAPAAGVDVAEVKQAEAAPRAVTLENGDVCVEGKLQVGLSWDFFAGQAPCDLDTSALCFDNCGMLLDACFFNNLKALDGAVQHSGDTKTGERAGFDESVVVDISVLPPSISIIAFVVNVHEGGSFLNVETAKATVQLVGGAEVTSCSVGCGSADTGLVLALLHRQMVNGSLAWCFRRIGKLCGGRTFAESLPSVRAVVDTLIDPWMRAERVLSMERTFRMNKGDAAEIPKDLFRGGDDFFVGLGWSCSTRMDLDASVLLYDDRNALTHTVYFGNKTAPGVQHTGDNMTGAGEGDDERINMDLDALPRDTRRIFVVVNIFSGGTFSNVTNAYVRLVAVKNGHELCRYPLDGSVLKSSGIIFAELARPYPSSPWMVIALGKQCGGRSATSSEVHQACVAGSTKADTASSGAGEASRGAGSGSGSAAAPVVRHPAPAPKAGCCMLL